MATDDFILKRRDELSAMDRIELRKEWIDVFGAAPAKFLSLIFMRKALIWQAQADALGELKQRTRKMLAAAVDGTPVAAPTVQVSLGTQLVREWNGRRYLVNVTKTGFELDGLEYASLTAIARQITGTNWSGPRFFGLTTTKVAAV